MQISENPNPTAIKPAPASPKLASTKRLRYLTYLSWFNLGGAVFIWLLFRFTGDRWWLSTALLFGPRWIWAGPLFLLFPLSLLLKRKLLWIHLAALIVIVFPIMGLCIPWRAGGGRGIQDVRVLDFNVDGPNLRANDFLAYVDKIDPDVIACEEFQDQTGEISRALIKRGWHIQAKTPESLFVASRFPILSETFIPTVEKWRSLAAVFELQTPAGPIHFVNLHLETPRKGLEDLLRGRHSEIQPMIDNIARRSDESLEISVRAQQLKGPVLIAGDFNLPADSAIFRDNWSRYSDAFSVGGFGFGYTKATREWGIRIDHLLADAHWRIDRCYVGPDLGSDHRPLITELRLVNN